MKRVHVFILGTVQGVGFRYFVKSNAIKLGLVGWVKNTLDGKVEVVLQGRIKKIEQMIVLCREGPFLAEVKDVQVKCEKEDDLLNEFYIK